MMVNIKQAEATETAIHLRASTEALSHNWQVYIDLDSIQLSKLKFDPPQPLVFT